MRSMRLVKPMSDGPRSRLLVISLVLLLTLAGSFLGDKQAKRRQSLTSAHRFPLARIKRRRGPLSGPDG